MTARSLPLLALLGLPLFLACPSKDAGDDDDDDGDGGGGWDLGTDGGSDGGSGDGGGDGGGGTDDDEDGWTTGQGDCDDGDPDINPGADEVWYDGVDQDCDGADDYDQDGDGDSPADYGGSDCDDTDPDRYGGAYDRPDDGIDQDCSGSDRTFDGIVLDAGETTVVELDANVPGSGVVDLALIVDTTGSMSSTLSVLDAASIASAVDESIDLQIGLATFQDYNYGAYGSGSDKPFVYKVGITSSISTVDTQIGTLSASGGSDSPESTMEALYQALVGDGYDQGCDGSYTSEDDVRPFRASSGDAFGGVVSGSYVSSTPGIGTRGGMGFRADATPVLAYITDAPLRDADSTTYGTPGGCPLDAGTSDVVAAAAALDAWVVGIATTTTPTSQMRTFATAGGWLADLDGDGADDDQLVYQLSSVSTMNTAIAGAIDAIVAAGGGGGVVSRMEAEATRDTQSLVSGISPSVMEDVDPADTPTVTFDITLRAPSTITSVINTTVEVEVTADGDVVATGSWDIELAPN